MKAATKWHETYNSAVFARPTRRDEQQAVVAAVSSNAEGEGSAGALSTSGSHGRPIGRKQAKASDIAKRKFQATIEEFVKSVNKRHRAQEAAQQELADDFRRNLDFNIITTNVSSLEDDESRRHLRMLKEEAFVRIADRNARMNRERQQQQQQEETTLSNEVESLCDLEETSENDE